MPNKETERMIAVLLDNGWDMAVEGQELWFSDNYVGAPWVTLDEAWEEEMKYQEL